MMKAAQITSYGGPEVMHVTDDAAQPKPKPGEVLVAVHAAAVNPFDRKVREGQARSMAELSFPATLGGDCAGVIAELGEGVAAFKVGDEVFGQANALGGQGSYAAYTAVKAKSLAKKPEKIDFVHAAAAPLTAVSAYRALVEHMQLKAGQKILIHGGAGGIGTFAIQLAKHLGAYIATTADPGSTVYVTELGADEVIDYTTQDFSVLLKDFDAVYDTVGGETYTKSFAVLKPGGVLVSMLEEPNEALAAQYRVKAISQFTQVTTARLEAITPLLNDGTLTVHIDKTFPLDEAAEAQEYLHAGKHHGKVVIAVTEPSA